MSSISGTVGNILSTGRPSGGSTMMVCDPSGKRSMQSIWSGLPPVVVELVRKLMQYPLPVSPSVTRGL